MGGGELSAEHLRTAGAIGCGLACLLLVAVQFAPWAQATTPPFPLTFPSATPYGYPFTSPGYAMMVPGLVVTAHTWSIDLDSGSDHTSRSWYSGDLDGNGNGDDVALIRAAIPLLLVGTLTLMVGTALTFLRTDLAGPLLCAVGTVLAGLGTVFFATAWADAVPDGAYEWQASFFLAIIAGVLALAGSILALVARRPAAPTDTGSMDAITPT